MTYAVIRNGVVVNLIWLYCGNEDDFPDAVPVNDLPVSIGDSYENSVFMRDGEPLLSVLEKTIAEKDDMQTALETVGVNVNG